MVDLDNVRGLIERALPGAEVEVVDETGTGDHLRATVAAPQFRGLGTTDQHRLSVSGEGHGVLMGCWDPDRLEQVLGNLLTNAIKYSPDGGTVDVTLATVEDEAGVWAHLSVRDRGLGIPADDLPRLFERFHRGGNVAGRIAGNGLGLAGAHQIVRQHGGTIAVDSEMGRGSTFTVRLPLAAGSHDPSCEGAGVRR